MVRAMSLGSTTIYSGWEWDDAFATAVLAKALLRKGYRVYIEFPSPPERKGLFITKAYSVGITHREGALLSNSIALQHIPEKRLGLVLKYDAGGNSDILMRFSNINSLTQGALEYIQTLNENIKIQDYLLKDIENMKNGNTDKLSKIGKIMLKSIKMNYTSKDFRKTMYAFAMEVLSSKNVKVSEDLLKEAEKYDKAMEIAQKIVDDGEYIPYGKLKVLVISSKFSRNLIKENYSLLRPVAYDLLTKVCRNDGVAVLVQETDLGHLIRICLRDVNVSFVKVISAIPKELSDRLSIQLRGNHLIIKYKDPKESTLNEILELTDKLATTISELLEAKK